MHEIRAFSLPDEEQILAIYRRAFQEEPWLEILPRQVVSKRWDRCQRKPGFRCLVTLIGGQIAGFIWWHAATPDELARDRGIDLTMFAHTKGNGCPLIWEDEVVTDPKHWGKGVATALRTEMLRIVGNGTRALVLTRMREDNEGILVVARRLGFQPTSLTAPSKKWPGVFHQYWYKITENPLQAE